jgi:hypothetical protein
MYVKLVSWMTYVKQAPRAFRPGPTILKTALDAAVDTSPCYGIPLIRVEINS